MPLSVAATTPTLADGRIEQCEHCGKRPVNLIEMKPGKDGVPWWLCVPCYEEGRQPMKLGILTAPARKTVVVDDPAIREALVKSGWRDVTGMSPAEQKATEKTVDIPQKQRSRAGGRGRGTT